MYCTLYADIYTLTVRPNSHAPTENNRVATCPCTGSELPTSGPASNTELPMPSDDKTDNVANRRMRKLTKQMTAALVKSGNKTVTPHLLNKTNDSNLVNI
ncbi:hypothetical protein KM043_012373 [Ampulex compressa]|nr:hypothetical protein KM043_012373 [Ampulex compressa]